MTIEQEITKAINALKDRHIKAIRKVALVQPGYRAKEKFLQAVMLHPWNGKGEAAMAMAYVIAQMMDWDDGHLGYCNSSNDLSIISGRPLSTARDGVASLIREGFLVAPARGPRQRGTLSVASGIKDREVGLPHAEHLSQRLLNIVNHIISSGRGGAQTCDDLGGVAPSLGGVAPTYPSLSLPVNKTSRKQAGLAGSGGGFGVDNGDASCFPSIHPTSPAPSYLYNSEPAHHVEATKAAYNADATKGKRSAEPPRPPVVDATKKSKTASATKARGYGDEIEGLNGSTHELVDRLNKLVPMNTNPDAGWHSVKSAMVRSKLRLGGDVEKAALVTVTALSQIEAKVAAGTLTSNPIAVLASFADRIDPARIVDKVAKERADKERYERLMRQRRFNPNLSDDDSRFIYGYERRREEWRRSNPEAWEAEKQAIREQHQRENAERSLDRLNRKVQPCGDYALEQDARRDGSYWSDPDWMAKARAKDDQRIAKIKAEIAEIEKFLEA